MWQLVLSYLFSEEWLVSPNISFHTASGNFLVENYVHFQSSLNSIFNKEICTTLLKSIWVPSNLPLKPVRVWHLGVSDDLGFRTLSSKLSWNE